MIVDDEDGVRGVLEQHLRHKGYEVAGVGSLGGAEEVLSREIMDLLFLDVRLPDGEGTDLLRDLQSRPVKPFVVIVTGFGSVESAVECMRNGAFDYLIKPFSLDQLEVILKKAEDYAQLLRVNRFLSHDESDNAESELLGESRTMEDLRQLIRKVARTQATVLIVGESGTGKELVARAIYRESTRSNAPFIKVNCAAIPESLIESEFFGHEKGAFTGAVSKREGRFELANGGTILLGEISEISPQVQAKLLRVLQERELERVGGSRTIKVDVRVLATTNRRLEESVQRGEFRQDLYFRLNVVPIHVPPLRDREGDIGHLAQKFAQRFARKHGVQLRGLSPDALRALEDHVWPGNVRELQNVIERAVILGGGSGQIHLPHLGLGLPGIGPTMAASPGGAGSPKSELEVEPDAEPTLAELERNYILAVLRKADGNRTQAARRLGISIRTMRNKLRLYGVNRPR